ncbi:biotin--[acetyl-CoA-carboxylase] ligase [Chitinimonas lacunae]|uniref:Bifunctional ligase/repressor BirA n=1 Tax=Chitinimonas lacunae TaxID=1963018 RepID=A0ABV8MTI1_9NEIS
MDLFPLLRLLADGAFHCGPDLAERLGVSRASVSLALAQAAEFGVEVHSVKGRGYRLSRPLDWLDEAAVARALGPAARFFDLKLFDRIDSTNSALLSAAQAGAPAGMVYAAEWQSAGRGRRGRRWQGELGATLMFSLLWRFHIGVAALSGLSLAVGLAVVRALETLGVESARLKWPNDIVCARGKLGGILIEVAGDSLGPSAVVIGIGLNHRLSALARAALDQAAADLTELGCPGDRNRLLAAILTQLAELLPRFERDGFAPFVNDWTARHALHGQPARLLRPDGSTLDGTVLGISADGALRFAAGEGEVLVHAGEVSLRAA